MLCIGTGPLHYIVSADLQQCAHAGYFVSLFAMCLTACISVPCPCVAYFAMFMPCMPSGLTPCAQIGCVCGHQMAVPLALISVQLTTRTYVADLCNIHMPQHTCMCAGTYRVASSYMHIM